MSLADSGYRESDLVANRVSVLLQGGGEADRQAWAEEAAQAFPAEGVLVVVEDAAALPEALRRPKGVVFVQDVLALSRDSQALILRTLVAQLERPKLVLGLTQPALEAVQEGLLRDDLYFRLKASQVNLADSAVKDAIRERRAAAREREAAEAKKAAATAKRSPIVRRPPVAVRSAKSANLKPAKGAKRA